MGSVGHRQWSRVGDGGIVRGDGEGSARAGSEVVRRGIGRGGQRERESPAVREREKESHE